MKSAATLYMPTLHKLIKALVLLFLIASFYSQTNIGLADNGDFSRATTWFSSAPVGFEPQWPATNTEDFSKRFFKYWLPAWKLDFPGQGRMKSSALLLWTPGILWNYYMVSPDVLYASNLSLAPKILLVCLVLLLFRWVETSEADKILKTCLLITLSLPLTLMFSTTDYVVYFNSFYFETASFVFLFAFLASLIFLKRRGPSTLAYVWCFASLLLLTMAKTSNIYWPLITLPLIFGFRNLRAKPVRYVPLYIVSAIVLTVIGFTVTRQPSTFNRHNTINRLFFGVLTFSREPSQRLAELNLSGAENCIGHPAFDAIGSQCQEKYVDRISIPETLLVLVREPGTLFRMMIHVAENMQKVSLDYLGKYSIDNPIEAHRIPLNYWSKAKSSSFPKGYLLWLTLILYLVIFISSLGKGGMTYELALVGLLATVALFVDMQVSILGDGRQELVKHLFLSNVLFDVASIAALNVLVLQGFQLARKKRRHTELKRNQRVLKKPDKATHRPGGKRGAKLHAAN